MLILVVGPSGAGKDTILLLARQILAGDPKFHFVRRVITRPSDPGAEDHESVSETEFHTRNFALEWQAHGLRYGIPAQALDAAGIVIANVSRSIIGEAATRFSIKVVEITAPPEILAERLAGRGRETASDIAGRLARSVPIPDHVDVYTIINDRTPQEAAETFVATLRSVVSRGINPAGQSVPPK